MDFNQFWEARARIACGLYAVLFPGIMGIVESLGLHDAVRVVVVVLQFVSAGVLLEPALRRLHEADPSEEKKYGSGAEVPLFIQKVFYFLFAAYAAFSGLLFSEFLNWG